MAVVTAAATAAVMEVVERAAVGSAVATAAVG